MKWRKIFPLTLLFLLFISVLSHTFIVEVKAQAKGNINFQPNVIPFLNVTDRPVDKPESFRFEWLGNKLDIELFFNATLLRWNKFTGTLTNITRLWSLRDFEDDFQVTVNYTITRSESHVQFGWSIDNPDDTSEWVHSALFKIEDTQPFEYDDIELEEVELLDETTGESYKVTRFNLPDNLCLSFEDLYHKGFVVGKPFNNTLDKTWDTKVEGFGGKKSWNLDPVTFSNNIMTFTGTSTDIFWDFWNASNVNGWNVAWNHRNNDTQYQFDTRLKIGDGSTPTSATGIDDQVTFADGTLSAHGQNIIQVTNNANLTLGTLIDDDDKTVKDGCEIRTLDSYVPDFETVSGSTLELFDTKLIGNPTRDLRVILSGTAKLYHVHFSKVLFIPGTTTITMYGLKLVDADLRCQTSFDTTPELVHEFYCEYAVRTVSAAFTIKNLYARGIINAGFRLEGTITDDSYVMDADLDKWTMAFPSASVTGELYRQYSFDLSVFFGNNTYAEGSNVTVSNSYLGTSDSWIISSNGSIPTQTYSMGHYNYTGGSSIYDYNPYNLTITLSGYTTYTTLLNITEQEDLKITLLEEQGTGGMASGFVFGGILAFMIMLVLGLAYFKKKS